MTHPPLTPPRDYRWDIVLGMSEDNKPVGIRLRDLEGHFLVYGSVGTGKTTMIKQLLYEASYGLNVSYTVLDYEGEYTGLGEATAARVLHTGGDQRHMLQVDLLDPGPLPPPDYASWLTSVLLQTFAEEGWSTTPQMEALLRRAVLAAVRERLPASRLVDLIHVLARNLPQGGQTAAALETRLSRLLEGAASAVIGGHDNTHWLVGTRTVVDLSGLARISPPDARLVAKILLGRIRHQARLGARRGTHLVVIEEAEHIASSYSMHRGPSLIAQSMMELRKRRVGLVVVAHSPSLLDPAVNRLASNVAVFNLQNGEDVRVAAATLSQADAGAIASRLQSLKRGEFILRAASAPAPFLVKTAAPVAEVLEDARRLLASIYTHPYLSTRERRAYLGMNGTAYRRVVERLVAKGVLRVVVVHQGVGRPVKLLQPRGMNPSVAHHYAVYNASKILKSIPCIANVAVEPGDGADIAAVTAAGTRIAVEVETGTNIAVIKYMNLLRRGYSYVIVLCTNKYCKRLARDAVERIGEERVVVTMLAFLKTKVMRLLGECNTPHGINLAPRGAAP